MDSLEELTQLYALQMTERERAEIEAQIWGLIPKADRPKSGIDEYIASKFGGSRYAISGRHFLYRAGRHADALWKRIESGMPLNSAVTILRRSRETARLKNLTIDDALTAELEKYDTTGYEVRSPDGKVIRRTKPSRLPTPEDSSGPHSAEGREFWNAIRRMFGDYLNTRLASCDPMELDSIRRTVESDLNVLLADMQKMISRASRGAMPVAIVARQVVVQACHTLGMDPPGVGKPVDMQKAKQQRKLYLRQYHPDVHGGSEATRPLYEATNEAFRIIEQYNENLRPSRSNTSGDK